jgi:hypothetical protein
MMDDMIAEQLEWLVAQNGNSGRMGRQIISLAGLLAEDAIPESIALQLRALSRLVLLHEIFDSLVNTLNNLSQYGMRLSHANDSGGSSAQALEVAPLLTQIESARMELSKCEPVGHAELIAWIMSRARQRKLLNERRSRR